MSGSERLCLLCAVNEGGILCKEMKAQMVKLHSSTFWLVSKQNAKRSELVKLKLRKKVKIGYCFVGCTENS